MKKRLAKKLYYANPLKTYWFLRMAKYYRVKNHRMVEAKRIIEKVEARRKKKNNNGKD